MDANGLNFWMMSQQQDWPLAPPLVPGTSSGVSGSPPPNLSSLEAGVGAGDGQVVLTLPLPAGAPKFVLVDFEVMSVSAIDAASLQLTVTRGVKGTLAANHPPGAAVWGPVANLASGAAANDTVLTLGSVEPGAIAVGAFLQIGDETLAVIETNATGTIVSVTRGALGSTATSYDTGVPVFAPIPSNTLYYCPKTNRLQLRSVRLGNPPVEDFSTASGLVETTPMARDSFGNYARWDPTSSKVLAGGSGPGEVPIYAAPIGQTVTDLTMGNDGILYIAVGGNLVLVDRQGRWPNFSLNVPGFNFWRLAALTDAGVLALDRTKPQLGTVTGAPLQTGPVDTLAPGILRSCQANPNPPHMAAVYSLPSEAFVAIAAAGKQFALLSWAANSASNTGSFLRLFDFGTGLLSAGKLHGIFWPYAVAWLADQRLAVLATGLKEALAFNFAESGTDLIPTGDTYVLSGLNKGPFAHSPGQPPYYEDGRALRPLLPLSLNSLAGSGSTDPKSPKILDSGAAQTVWHRLFLEAVLPPRCSVVVWLTAAELPSDITAPAATWYPHAFGDADMAALPAQTPKAVWLSISSEVPFATPLLGAAPIANRQGLFMVLVQRAQRAVRKLSGRFLGIRVELQGDRRSTPEIAALRVWGARFSYVGNYLPELYRENRFGPAADVQGNSTRRDFFDRFVAMFEAQLTRIEDSVANSYLLTRPEIAPDDALDWLGGWIGLIANGYPPDRRRARLLASASLHRQRGTLPGITQALDIATDGLCSRGAVIIVEDFRLRHIFATILGANLGTQNDPLLPGYGGSSNSFVGDTLFLGNPRDQAEVLALFSGLLSAGEEGQVQQFYDSLANRMTVFIHNQVETVDVNLVQRIVECEKPAYVAASFRIASQPFMVGLAALLGIDSYLAPEPPRDPVVLGSSQIGRYNMVIQAPSLDPRLET